MGKCLLGNSREFRLQSILMEYVTAGTWKSVVVGEIDGNWGY
jgi:hypothetical protein